MPERSRSRKARKRSSSSRQSREAVDFDTWPSPASSHSDSTSRTDKPRTKAPITSALSGSLARKRLRRRKSLLVNGAQASRTCGTSTTTSPSPVFSLRGR